MKTLYIAGPYTADTTDERDKNVEQANQVAIEFAERGWAPYCPHTQSWNWENVTDLDYDDFMEIDFEWISRCDAICMLPGWRDSKGAKMEYEVAQELGLPIYYYEHHEWECPTGRDFRHKVMEFKREEGQVIIDKQRDYGPGNINAFGDFGILVRINDKLERLKNLYTNSRDPQHESVDDSWMDASNYGTIARMYRDGEWPT